MSSGLSIRLKFFQLVRESAAIAAAVLKPALARHTRIMGLLLRINSRVLALPTTVERAAEDDNFVKATKDFTGEPGVNLLGYISAESGVGEGARGNIRILQSAGIALALNNLDCASRQGDRTYTDFRDMNPFRINLLHVNADAVRVSLQEKGIGYLSNKYNIGYWAWELSDFPEIWFDRFQFFHEIWVPSFFCQDAIARTSPIPVLRVPHSIEVKEIKDIGRARFGIAEDKFAFLFMFDLFSYLERKNPFALIRAFRDAFPREKDVVLVLKCSNMKSGSQEKEALLKEASGLDVKFIDGYLDRDEIHALIRSCDCYVSLHRSEGFGLPLAEAMCLGKPVIATGYSGNTDFMNVNNSLLVKYSLVELEKDIGPYKKGNVWADPDHGHAVELMRLVYNDRRLCERIGKQASADIKTDLSPGAIGKNVAERLKRLPIW